MSEKKISNGSFRKPLGLLLAGGGALGAWQAGFLDALVKRGLVFEKVMGFSAGVLTGGRYAFGWQSGVLDRWRNISDAHILRFAPRLKPLSLFSDASIWETIDFVRSEEQAKADLRCELTVMSFRMNDAMPVYSRFTPRGEGGWDGPMGARIAASCSIPLIFPPVAIEENGMKQTYVDGGVPGREWMRCDALAGCADVIAIEMVRPEEIGRRAWLPWSRHDQKGREIVYKQISSGIESLRKLPQPPRIFRVCPSQILDFSMLSFKSRYCGAAVERGIFDAEKFLNNLDKFIVPDMVPSGH